MLIKRKAATNVVATMLIFGIMVASIGVLYGQIAPTLLGYETNTTSTNQNFVFETISQRYMELASSSEGTVGLVHIVSEETQYDLDDTVTLNFDVQDSDGSLLPNDLPQSVIIGTFESTVFGSFQPSDQKIQNRVSDTSIFMNNNSNNAQYVLTSEYGYSEGNFRIYFRSLVDTFFIQSTNTWKMTITVMQITFLPSFDGTPAAFPIEIPEWTLRMRRQSSSIINVPTQLINNSITLSHDLDGVAGTDFTYPDIIPGQNIDIQIIVIPVLFGI